MMSQATNATPALSVAVVDDVFAKPDRESVESALPEFCAAVEEFDVSQSLLEATGNNFLDPALVDDDAIAALFDRGDSFPDFAVCIKLLFAKFMGRRNDLNKIIEGIMRFKGVSLTPFDSIDEFKKSTEKFRVVFLDYRLKEAGESAEIAKAVYKQHRSFIVLMSDLPDTSGNREADFREQVGLLQGFFKYVPKGALVDPGAAFRTMSFVPENPTVCHAIHDLIDGLEQSLAGDEKKGGGPAVAGFMATVRNLPLQDYALLCELTLADEGHPLGDYIRRLFGAHLIKQVFTTESVSQSLKGLDSLRFTEFLPLAGEPSDSLKEFYASSLVEPITNPWGEHPWENEVVEEEADDTPNVKASNNIGTSVDLYGWHDDKRPLPFVQLGDVFVRDDQNWVFVVINASCDLQIVPTNVSMKRNTKGRTRNRNDTVLLLPGEVCALGTTTPKSITTGLFAIADKHFAIDWKPKQMISIPQCCLRAQLQDRGYSHNVRLQMDRAIELQQEVFASNSRVGLEIQPQLSRSVGLRISARIAGKFKVLGDDITRAGGIFHTRNKTVLVMNHDCLIETLKRLEENAHTHFSEALNQLKECCTELYRCPFIAERGAQTVFKLIKPNNTTHSCKKIRVGLSAQPQSTENCEGQLYLHFFDRE